MAERSVKFIKNWENTKKFKILQFHLVGVMIPKIMCRYWNVLSYALQNSVILSIRRSLLLAKISCDFPIHWPVDTHSNKLSNFHSNFAKSNFRTMALQIAYTISFYFRVYDYEQYFFINYNIIVSRIRSFKFFLFYIYISYNFYDPAEIFNSAANGFVWLCPLANVIRNLYMWSFRKYPLLLATFEEN